jgi:hypothetical protein
MAAWAASMDADLRKELNGRTLTQLLLGETVHVVEDRGDWVKVVAPAQPSSLHESGYPGWVRRGHLDAPVSHGAGASARITGRTAVCESDLGTKLELSFGTRLWVDTVTDDTVVVLLPGDRRAAIPLDHVQLSQEDRQPGYRADDLLDTARQFLALRYLWGGTSAWGLDCSGLVHLTFRVQDVVLPRDACDQAGAVTPIPLDEVQPGDLYFFARPEDRIYHVGFVSRPVQPDGTRWMLHAPESGELIEDMPMAPHRTETLLSAGRVVEPSTGFAPSLS